MQGVQSVRRGLPHEDAVASAQRGERPRLSLCLHGKSRELHRMLLMRVGMDILSMGMTNDYEVAIEEGATMVGVGTGIFGARNYNK